MYAHPQSLSEHTVIVTGASRGVGLGIATALAERGARLFLTDIDGPALTAAHNSLEAVAPAVASVPADLREPRSASVIVDAATARFGTLTGLVNNAVWVQNPTPFVEQDDAAFARTFDTGPRATFHLMKAAYPHLKAAGGGSIINLGSSAGTGGEEGFAAYAGAKEAIRGITRVASLEWGKDAIRANIIAPYANSEGMKAWETVDPDAYHRALQRNPMGRIGDVKADIGAVAAWLIGDESTYITGRTFMVDGGAGAYR
ncbi:SDR family NAD(P)-dependent oxidoreductase [Streptomyces niveus]|uniref:SDR family NAD(P)-dependent oxidoreductase n=1 Tax=Streptomyces niveus TaxID=193462 RepID=UPI00344860F0